MATTDISSLSDAELQRYKYIYETKPCFDWVSKDIKHKILADVNAEIKRRNEVQNNV